MKTTKGASGLELAVRVIYGDCVTPTLPVRLLDARTEPCKDIEEVARVIRLVRHYNNFDGDEVAAELLDLHEDGVISYAQVGREGSPALYIGVPFWTGQRSNVNDAADTEPIPDAERQDMERRLEEAMHGLLADEVSWEREGLLRAWWD